MEAARMSADSVPAGGTLTLVRTENIRFGVPRRLGGFMKGLSRRLWLGLFLAAVSARSAWAQKAMTWQEIRDKFEAANPTLRAGQIGIDESRAQEITAYLRPNPNFTILADQIDPFGGRPAHGPFAYLLAAGSVNYLWERQHKRGLRLESAQKGTAVVTSAQAD